MNYIDVFLESLAAERGRSRRTLASYASDLHHADETLPNGLMGATAVDIQNYLSHLPQRATSIARHASALRGFYKFLMLEKIITENPAANLELPKRTRALPKFLSVDEIELLISSAGDTKNALQRHRPTQKTGVSTEKPPRAGARSG